MRHSFPPRASFPLAALCAAGLGAACSSPPPVAQVPIGAPKPDAPAPGADPTLATITAVRKPEKLVVDGDPAEWDALVPVAAGSEKGKPPPASHVGVALHSTGAALAAEVANDPSEGVWIGLSFGEPELPPIGTWLRYGAIAELNCEYDIDHRPLDAASAAACKKLLADHAAFGEAHRARFRSFYKLDDKGIRALRAGGALVPVEGAQAVIRPTASGFTAEATLPAKALPRTQQAPLEGFRALARIKAGGKPPEVGVEEWESLDPPEPVGFEPHASLRAAVFAVARGRYRSSPFDLSYQPGDDLQMERIGYVKGDTTAVDSYAEILYSKQIKLNRVEVGYANLGGAQALAVIPEGEPEVVTEMSGEPRGVVQRGSDLHVFSYDRYSPSDAYGTDFATWHAWKVEPDGAVRDGLLDKENVPFYWAQNELVESHLPDFSILKLSGHPPGTFDPDSPGDAPTIECTWTWDPKEGLYTIEVTDSRDGPKKPAPKSKPAQKPKAPARPAATPAAKPAATPAAKPAATPKK